MTTPPRPDAGVLSRMEQKLAETDRIGIISLRKNLLEGGANPRTVEHVIELLTSRTLTIYHFAEQCRKKEAEVATLTAQLAAANADGERYRFWRDAACDTPSLIARNLTSCLYTHEIDETLDRLLADAARTGAR